MNPSVRMKRILALFFFFSILPIHSRAVSNALTPIQIKEAIDYGAQWKSGDKFIKEGLKPYKFQIASIWATDGTTKYITFLTDWINVAAASVDANRKMMTLSQADIDKITRPGLLSAVVEIHGRGMLGASRAGKRYGNGQAHMVLKFGDTIVQPVDITDQSDVHAYSAAMWLFVGQTYNDLGWFIGGPVLQYQERKLVMRFSYALTKEQMGQRGEAILIDADGRRHAKEVDFSKLR